jgi:hypothetical protein
VVNPRLEGSIGNDNEQAKIGEEKVMEKEKLLLTEAQLRPRKALEEKIRIIMELPAPNTFQNQIYYVYCKWEGHLLVDCKNIKRF